MDASKTNCCSSTDVLNRQSVTAAVRLSSENPVCSDQFSLKPTGVREREIHVKRKLILL